MRKGLLSFVSWGRSLSIRRKPISYQSDSNVPGSFSLGIPLRRTISNTFPSSPKPEDPPTGHYSQFILHLDRPVSPANTQDFDLWLRSNLDAISNIDLIEILKAWKSKGGLTLTYSAAFQLEANLRKRFFSGQKRNWQLIAQATKLHRVFESAGITLIPLMQDIAQSCISDILLTSQKPAFTYLILSSFLNVLYPHKVKSVKFPTRSGPEIFDLAAKTLNPLLLKATDSDLMHWYNILRVFLLMDAGTEDFRRALEKFVIGNMSKLPVSSLVDLPFAYKNRVSFDYKYVQNEILRPFSKELVRAAPSLSATQLGLICYRLWSCFSRSGLYCDAEVVHMLKTRVNDASWLSANTSESVVFFLQSVVTYLMNAGHFGQRELYDQIIDLVLLRRTALTLSQLAKLAAGFAKGQHFNLRFWNVFAEEIKNLVKEKDLHLYLYAVLLTLKFAAPGLHQACFRCNELTIAYPEIAVKWKKERLLDVSTSPPSWLHKRLETYFHQRGLSYEREYYDEYYIDLALLKSKVALEICGPYHYVLPGLTLTGKTQAKKYILEQLGWRVAIVPFFYQGEERFDEKMDELLEMYVDEIRTG